MDPVVSFTRTFLLEYFAIALECNVIIVNSIWNALHARTQQSLLFRDQIRSEILPYAERLGIENPARTAIFWLLGGIVTFEIHIGQTIVIFIWTPVMRHESMVYNLLVDGTSNVRTANLLRTAAQIRWYLESGQDPLHLTANRRIEVRDNCMAIHSDLIWSLDATGRLLCNSTLCTWPVFD
jgi:hypothetical protein